MIILNLIREHEFMATVALFEKKKKNSKILKKHKAIIELFVSALKRSSEAPRYFL